MAKKNIKEIYDTCSMLTKRIEGLVAANKPIDKGMLDALSSAFSDIMEYEKFYLISCQDKFYGSVLMDMNFGIDFKQRGPVDLKIDCDPFTLSVNPLFCSKYKFPEFTGLIVSEIVKMIWLHPASFATINHEKDPKKHELLEKASDAASNSIVTRDIHLNSNSGGSNGCRLPEGAYTPTQLNAELKVKASEGQILDYYYNILNKFKKDPPDSSKNQQQQNQNNGSSSDNGDNSVSPDSIATQNNNSGNDVHDWEGKDSDDIKESITAIVSNALNSIDDDKRGFIPASIMSQIKKLLEPPEIPWQSILRKMIGSVPVPYRKTRTRLNRRQPYRADLCGKLPKRIVNVVVAFDTSGSMSDDDLKYCLNEVFNLIKSYEGYKVTIIECDAEIQRVYTAKNMLEVQTKMRGRGGTSFVPVIEFINGEGQYKDSKKYPLAGTFRDALMVYFTDGFGDYEIPKPKTYRNLWVVLKDVKNLSLKEPYGEVKSLMMDEKYKKMRNGF